MQRIRDFLLQHRIAIVGVSRNPNDFSRMLFREFQKRGYDVVPVNPGVTEIEGRPCVARLQDVRPPVDGVLLMTPPAVTGVLVEDCAAAGVPRVWIYRRAPAAVAYCEAHGIAVIAGECPLMYLSDTGWFHRLHGWFHGVRGSQTVSITSDISHTRPGSAPSGPSDNSAA